MRYSRMTEEGFYRGRPWDYLWMLLLGGFSMAVIFFPIRGFSMDHRSLVLT